jgi:hypothetical protein
VFFIPGFVIALATFPGVILHEAAHVFFCRWQKVAIFRVCYFQLGLDVAGYVEHEATNDLCKAFWISMGPLFVNTLLCIVFCSAAVVPIQEFGIKDPIAYFFYWLGISMGMHALPSSQDVSNFWMLIPEARARGDWFAYLCYPLAGALYLANLGKFFWIDYGYGLAVGILGPLAVLRLVAG